MNKLLLISSCLLVLSACSEKQAYEQALLDNIKKEQDVKDYHIPPEDMVKCVFNMTSENMPGFAVYDPYRRATYEKYAKMLSFSNAPDPKKALEELNTVFGSPKKLMEARSNYTESVMECYSVINDTRSDELKAEAQQAPAEQSQKEAEPTAK